MTAEAVAITLGALAAVVATAIEIRRRIFVRKVHQARDTDVELAAKDQAINTKQQVIEALGERVEQLERDQRRLQTALDDTATALELLRKRYEILEAFAAPQAFKSIDSKLDALMRKLLQPAEITEVLARISDPLPPPRAR